MDDTRSFRLSETMDTMEITLNHVDGQNIVLWEDIEQVFPGVKRVRNGNSVIKFHRRSIQESTNCCPHSVLDVVLSTSVEPIGVNPLRLDPTDRRDDLTDAPADAPPEDRTVTALDITPCTPETTAGNIGLLDTTSSLSSDVDASLKATLPQKVVTLASRKAQEYEIEQRLISLLAPEVQGTVRASSDIYQAFAKAIKGGNGGLSRADLRQELDGPFKRLEAMIVAKNTELQEEMSAMRKEINAKQEEMIKLQEVSDAKQEEIIRLQEEMKQMQQRALNQLSVLQSRVQAVLTQTYELHEYPIPRLFIVLPQYPSGWNILEPFTDKYRLYFLCECGEHTKAAGSNNKIPHEIHLAKHEGYEIARPTDFFQQYGPYVLTILKMLKFSVSVASVAIPAVSHLINADSLDHAAKGLQHLKDCIEPGMDQVISKIETNSVDEGEPVEDFADQMENKEALEGADLRKLETFLKDKDENKVLGNLYKTVTDEGHIKWVCMDHYRENYNKTVADGFQRSVESLGGSFDENNGLVKVKLGSRVSANQLYLALEKARSVYELDIDLDWACTMSDLEALEDALMKSRVAILRLDLRQFRSSAVSKVLTTSTQYDFLFRIRDLPNMKVLHIVVARELIKFLGFPPKKSSHVCKMSCELVSRGIGGKEFGILAEALKTNSTLTTLNLERNSIGDNGAQALSEALKTNLTLTTLNLECNSIRDNGAQALSEALKTNSTLTTLNLWDNSIGFNGAQALSEALKTNSTLATLNLERNSIGNNGAQALSEALKTNSTLTTLNLQSNKIGDNGAKALAEALKTNSTLTTLNLSYNSIGPNGAQALSEALMTNSTLTTLNLQSNSIGDSGAQALSEALKTNSTLATLDLWDNSIGDNGAQALSEALKINSTVKAVLTPTYELHEYPTPRLFVVLTQDPSRWNTVDPFSNKFRLYFLCECGELTKSVDSGTEIHFTKHEGYELARPTEFFQLYGSHVFAILKLLKFGISAAGVAVPAISHLVRADVIDQATTYLQLLKVIEPMMDPVIDWMDKVSANEDEVVDEFAKQMENKEALADADLRKLETFLKDKDENKVLGNLYRTVTDEGHVKWVCIDHYREKFLESLAKDLQRMLDSVGGSFNKSIGRVEVALRSRELAEQFFSALGKARSVYELEIVFDWACTTSDLELLERALKMSTRVSILKLDLRQFQTSKLLSTSSQYGVLFRFPEVPSMKTVHIILPNEYTKCLSFQPKAAAHSCKSSFELATGRIGGNEVGRLAAILKTNSTLTILDLYGNSIGDNGAQALAETLKINSTLTTLNLWDNSIGFNGAQALSVALKTNSTLTTLNLKSNPIEDNGAWALSEALKTNSTLTTLNLYNNSIEDNGAQALSEALKINSTLVTLDLSYNSIGNNGAHALSEALKINSTLTTLELYYNSIGSNGAQALSEVLKTNWTLTIMGVSDLTKYSKQ